MHPRPALRGLGRGEHVFARLKTFKVLQGLLPYRWQRLGDILRALAVAHNLNRQLAVQVN